jgi:Lipase (class 3)
MRWTSIRSIMCAILLGWIVPLGCLRLAAASSTSSAVMVTAFQPGAAAFGVTKTASRPDATRNLRSSAASSPPRSRTRQTTLLPDVSSCPFALWAVDEKQSSNRESSSNKSRPDGDAGNKDDINDTSELPSWISGLNQWPLTRPPPRPPPPPTTTTSSTSSRVVTKEFPPIDKGITTKRKRTPEEEQQALLEKGTMEAARSRIGNLLNVQALLSLRIPMSGSSSSSRKNSSSVSSGRSTMNFLEALSGGGSKGEVMSKSSSSMLAQVDDILFSMNKNASQILLSSSSSSSPLVSSTNSLLLSPLLTYNATTPTTTTIWQELSAWDQWMDRLQSSMTNLRDATSNTTKFAIAAESILKQATSRLESLLNEASTVVSPATVGELIFKASQAVLMYNATMTMTPYASLAAAGSAASEAAVLDTLDFAVTLVSVADRILRQGYVRGDPAAGEQISLLQQVPKVPGNDRALFDDYTTAVEMNRYTAPMNKAAEMGMLAGSIYDATPLRTLTMSHSIVASGVTKDVRWTITDSMANHDDFAPHHYHDEDDDYATSSTINKQPQDPKSSKEKQDYSQKEDVIKKGKTIAVRTIVIRGFDASDENVDREDLVTRICLARPQAIQAGGGSSTSSSGGVSTSSSTSVGASKASTTSSGNIKSRKKTILVHSGLWDMAQAIYKDVKQYVEWSAPSHRIVITGHSIGGSIALLVLFLMTMDRGVDFVKRKVVRVYTFGSPPVTAIPDQEINITNLEDNNDNNGDDILQAFGLPCEMVHAFVQPWDPIVRLFTKEDPLYPLISDVGDEWDGVTPWPKGPPRTLRPILKTIFESWNGWPRFREEARGNLGTQDYSSVGIQFVLLPEPARYLADRFLAINLAVPPVHTVLRISPRELLPSLVQNFPLDVFEISFIPQALRSFIHHFFPAYGSPFADYVRLLKQATSSSGNAMKGGGVGIPAAAAKSSTATIPNERLTTTSPPLPRTDEDALMMQDMARRESAAATALADGEQDNDGIHKDDAFGWMRAAPWLLQRKDES